MHDDFNYPPDLPIPVRDETQDDLQEENALQEHHAPPSDVEITETESVSVLEGVDEANSKEWKAVKNKTKTPHTVTRAGRRCYTPKHLQKDQALMATQRKSSPNPFAALYSDDDEDEEELKPAGPEVAAIGAGTMANNVFNTAELKPMKYKQAMKTRER